VTDDRSLAYVGALQENELALAADEEGNDVSNGIRSDSEQRGLRNDLNARGMYYSGEYGYLLGLAKERALQAYRDQETRARREAARILDAEGWMHEGWRTKRNMPRPTLTASTRVEPILNVWKLPPSKHGGPPRTVDDPAMRAIGQIISGLDADAEDFV